MEFLQKLMAPVLSRPAAAPIGAPPLSLWEHAYQSSILKFFKTKFYSVFFMKLKNYTFAGARVFLHNMAGQNTVYQNVTACNEKHTIVKQSVIRD
jgi:hypothetical protein